MPGRSDIVIQPITDDLIEGYHHALDVVARERRYLTLLEAPPLPGTRAFVKRIMEAGEIQLVALSDDQVVGWIDIQREFWPSHAHRGKLGMGLLPAHRGRGIGRMLMEAALKAAWGSGLTRVELAVHADNAPAIALYERLGFEREGVLRNASLIDGRYRDAIAMAILRP